MIERRAPALGTTACLPCPACGDSAFRQVISASEVAVWKCQGCGMGQTVPAPAEAEGNERTRDDLAHFAEAYRQPKDRWWRRFNDAPLGLLASAGLGPDLRLLDVGCNLGYLVRAARSRGYDAIGVDASPAAVGFGRDVLGLPLLCARAEEAPIPEGSVDVVTANHVLEHLREPQRLLRRCHAWLRPHGWILVTLPNFASPIARLAGARWAGLVPSQHVWHFTPAALGRMLAREGFRVMRVKTRMLVYAPRTPRDWTLWLARRLFELAGEADNLLVLARKASEG